MAASKKFGTFSGVFTPSILTILGVIMYLRFPTIIGQTGLINTLGIIVIAHIISITTSLSVASLSTDKPVQTGGTYFMISRSLGLPIGGTLGLALFVGLSFSVSLYLIGFAESFLQYWNMENSLTNIRIAGATILVLVTTITFISTSLAIKSQFFIMAAIVLSLLSIFLGNHEFTPNSMNIEPIKQAAPFMVLFGIFFPAVTGFEAGVSMSGDLKDPKKSLPVGAIAAVLVGFVAYIGLAFFYAKTVDAHALANDPQILFKISLVPELVIAGIWGATLSSAFGSILGAPRILQAIAMDKIAPRIFAKGTGKTNEPRNALLLAFVIALSGILIGKLDVIARIVSMFFITTYAFLNLASAIESWASSDFRPAFRVPRFVSILGAISAFMVMILLDFLALAGATIVLGLLFLYLQRKELILESGDAWGSFWTNMAKKALLRLSKQKVDTRNWRPNIILFSGGIESRPHLVEMGLTLTGKLGALTDFSLLCGQHETTNKLSAPARSLKKRNYFTRILPCKTIQEGIETVTSVYGFSGFEPNTVLMGWSRAAHNEAMYLDILKNLQNRNMNTVFLDYDRAGGFGKRQQIDIWWNARGRHLSFSLNILRFILADRQWRDANVRILVINSDTSLNDSIYRNITAILKEKRMKAKVKVLADDFGSRDSFEVINSESENADLLIFELRPDQHAFIKKYNEGSRKSIDVKASKLFLSPSDEFESINLVDKQPKLKPEPDFIPKTIELSPMPHVENSVIQGRLQKQDSACLIMANQFAEKVIHEPVNNLKNIQSFLTTNVEQNLNTLKRELETGNAYEYKKIVARNHQAYLLNLAGLLENKNNQMIIKAQDEMQHGLTALLARIGNFIYEAQELIYIPQPSNNKTKTKDKKFPYRDYLTYYFGNYLKPELIRQTKALEDVSAKQFELIRKLLLAGNDYYEKLALQAQSNHDAEMSGLETIQKEFGILMQQLEHFKSASDNEILIAFRELTINMATQLQQSGNQHYSKNIKQTAALDDKLKEFASDWSNGMQLLSNSLYLDVLVLSRKNIARNVILSGNDKLQKLVDGVLLKPLNQLKTNLEQVLQNSDAKIKSTSFPDSVPVQKTYTEALRRVVNITNEFPKEIRVPEALFRNGKRVEFTNFEAIKANLHKSATYYMDTLFYEPLYREVEFMENTLNEIIMECVEVNSMLTFHQNNPAAENDEIPVQSNEQVYQKLLKRVVDEHNKIDELIEKVSHYAQVYLHEAFSRLFFHSVLESELYINIDKRKQTGRHFNKWFNQMINAIRGEFSEVIVNILNVFSSGVLLSKKYLQTREITTVQNRQILDLVEQTAPKPTVYQTIPVFYRSLMSNASKINDEFWVPRNMEYKLIKEALQRHRSGIGGALLIKGVRGAGKTALSRYAATHLFRKNNIFRLNAKSDGSTSVPDFLAALQSETSQMDSLNSIFNNMPYESVLVIDDLELWWERRPGGDAVVLKILELIQFYGNKVFFILNCNTHAFNLMQKLMPISEACIAEISCEPFNTSELQQLVLSRHQSSGINLSYGGKPEDSVSQLSYSVLFNSYFHITGGIPGQAINLWNANIVEAAQDKISIKKPHKINATVLNYLQQDWLVLITLFIQHKFLYHDKIQRLTNYSDEQIQNYLHNMKNAGILTLNAENSYILEKHIAPYLTEVCLDKGLI